MIPENKQIAANGTFQVIGTSEITKKFFAFHAEEGTVLASVKDEDGNDIRLELLEIEAAPLMANTFYTRDAEKTFSAITLTSGKVNLFLENS